MHREAAMRLDRLLASPQRAMQTRTRVLWHFTAPLILRDIVTSRRLVVSESNVGSGRRDRPPHGEHVGPDVVWLFDTATPAEDTILGDAPDQPIMDKRLVRIGVRLPEGDAIRWRHWPPRGVMHPKWRRVFEDHASTYNWFVIERDIPAEEWISIEWRPTRDTPRWRPFSVPLTADALQPIWDELGDHPDNYESVMVKRGEVTLLVVHPKAHR